MSNRDTMNQIATRLKIARQAKFRTAAEAARAVGLKPVTVRAHENGQNGVGIDVALKYCQAYGVTPQWLMYGVNTVGEVNALFGPEKFVPFHVHGTLRAGTFREKEDLEDNSDLFFRLDVSRRDTVNYLVKGNGADLSYKDGELLICAIAREVDIFDGDHVIVSRRKAGLIELTVRELRSLPDGSLQLLSLARTGGDKPWPLVASADQADGIHIRAVVVAQVSRAHRDGVRALVSNAPIEKIARRFHPPLPRYDPADTASDIAD